MPTPRSITDMLLSSNIRKNLVALGCLWLLFPPVAGADIFRHVDADGVIHFTNTPVSSAYSLYRKENGVTLGLSDIIRRNARFFGLEEALIKAVIKTESDFDPRRVSHKGAQGLMQLMPETASDMDVVDPFDTAQNVRGGSRYLRYLLDQFNGDLELTLAAYNAGPGAVRRYEGVPPYEETRNYIRKVTRHLSHYRREPDSVQ